MYDLARVRPLLLGYNHRMTSPDTPNIPPNRWLQVLFWLILTATALGRFFEGWNEDELMHLHAAWLIGQGLVPYRDYFDHYMPLFHVLFAGPATWFGTHYVALYIFARVVAFVVAAAAILLMCRSANWAHPDGPYLAGLVLLSARYADFLFLLRPDFVALLLLSVAVVLLSKPTSVLTSAGAGLAFGLASLCTQKTFAFVPAFVLWQVLRLWHCGAGSRAQEVSRAAGLLIGMVLPPLVLWAALARLHALSQFMAGQIIGLHWKPPGGRFYQLQAHLQEPLLAGLLPFGFGVAWAFRALVAGVRGTPETYRGDLLLGLMGLFGIAAFVRIPAPTQHALVFTTLFWIMACAARHIAYAAATGRGRSLIASGAASVVALAALRPYNVAVAVVLWSFLGWLAWRAMHASFDVSARHRRLLAALCSLGLLVWFGNFIERAVRMRVVPQVRAMAQIDAAIPRGGRVLTTWPVLTPARPHACYHWFSDVGMYLSLPRGTLEAEQIAASRSPKTAVLVCEPTSVRHYAPALWQVVRERWRDIGLPPGALKRARAYVRRWAMAAR